MNNLQMEILEDMYEVFKKFNIINKQVYLKNGKYTSYKINKEFNSFNNALLNMNKLNFNKLNINNNNIISNKKQKMIDKVLLIYKKYEYITQKIFLDNSTFSVNDILTEFNSFDNLLEQACILDDVKKKRYKKINACDKRNTKNVSKEKIINSLLNIYSQNKENFSATYFYNESGITRSNVLKYFNSFEELCLTFNIPYKSKPRAEELTKEDIVNIVKKLYHKNNKLTSRSLYNNSIVKRTHVESHFKSFSNMMNELGLNYQNHHISYEELLLDIQNIISKHGYISDTLLNNEGKYSSTTYFNRIGNMEKINYIFNISPIFKINAGISNSAIYCLYLIGKILKSEFELEKTFDWLTNCKTDKRLRLDGYFENYNLAVEYMGSQHYEHNQYFDKTYEDFLNRKNRDIIKKELCLNNNIKILYVKYDEPLTMEYLTKKLIDEKIISK